MEVEIRLRLGGLGLRIQRNPAGPSRIQLVTSFVICLGGEGRHLFASFSTQPRSRTTQRRSQTSPFPFAELSIDRRHGVVYTHKSAVRFQQASQRYEASIEINA